MEELNLISIETANKMLPLVSPITKEMQSAWKAAIYSQADHLGTLLSSEEDQSEQIEKTAMTLRRSTKTICKNIDELEKLGCIVESFENGIIDFPSKVEEEEVMLCWKFGEKEVLHHHKRGETVQHRLLISQVLE